MKQILMLMGVVLSLAAGACKTGTPEKQADLKLVESQRFIRVTGPAVAKTLTIQAIVDINEADQVTRVKLMDPVDSGLDANELKALISQAQFINGPAKSHEQTFEFETMSVAL